MPLPSLIIPASTPTAQWKQRLYGFVGPLTPEYLDTRGRKRPARFRVKITPGAENPSEAYRDYYFAVVVESFAGFLRGTGQPIPEGCDSFEDYAHKFLKKKRLSYAVPDPETGELTHVVGSIANGKISPERFDQYVNEAREYLWEKFEIPTPDPDPNWRSAGGCGLGRRESAATL